MHQYIATGAKLSWLDIFDYPTVLCGSILFVIGCLTGVMIGVGFG